MSRQLPENCTVVIKFLQPADGERIKAFCVKSTQNLSGGLAVCVEQKSPIFPDYRSGGDSLRACQVIGQFLEISFPSRNIKPVASIKGSEYRRESAGRPKSINSGSSVVSHEPQMNKNDFCIWVGNLPREVSREEISHIFMDFGSVQYVLPQHGDARSSAFVNFEAFAGASSALAELSQGLFVGKIKLKGDAGRNASFVLDLLIELETLSTQSMPLQEAVRISRESVFPPANVQYILRRIDCVAIDEEEQTVSLHPTRKLNTDELLAMSYRKLTKVVARGGRNTAQPSPPPSPKQLARIHTKMQTNQVTPIAGAFLDAVETEQNKIWQILCDSACLSVDISSPPLHNAEPVVVQLINAYGEEGISGVELGGMLFHCLALDRAINLNNLQTYLLRYPEVFHVLASADCSSFYVVSRSNSRKTTSAARALASPATVTASSPAAAKSSMSTESQPQSWGIMTLTQPGFNDGLGLTVQREDGEYEAMMSSINELLLPAGKQAEAGMKQEHQTNASADSPSFFQQMPGGIDHTPQKPPPKQLQQPPPPPPHQQQIQQQQQQMGCERSVWNPSSLASTRLPPDAFICPISFQIMVDPVTTIDGMTYSRSTITKWLAGHDTSPMTNVLLLREGRLDKSLCPNYALKMAIHEWMQQDGHTMPPSNNSNHNNNNSNHNNNNNTYYQMPGTFNNNTNTNFKAQPEPPLMNQPLQTSTFGGKPLFQMTVSDVFQFFLFCNFETAGVVAGSVDGPTLYYLFTDANSQQMLTAPSPEGLGLSPLQVKARLTFEMNRLIQAS